MDYPLSIIGIEGAHDTLITECQAILSKHFDTFGDFVVRASKTGRYHAIKTRVRFDTAEQVNALYADFATARYVRTVL